jgi:hypothetical protein
LGVAVGVAVGVGVDVGVAEGVTVGDVVGVGVDPGWQTLLPPGPEHWLEQHCELFWQEAPAVEQNGVGRALGVGVGVVEGVAVGVGVAPGSATNALLNVVVEVMSRPARFPTPSVPLGPKAPTAISNVPLRS